MADLAARADDDADGGAGTGGRALKGSVVAPGSFAYADAVANHPCKLLGVVFRCALPRCCRCCSWCCC